MAEAVDVIHEQLEAYNDGDVDRFASCFAENAIVESLLESGAPTEGTAAIRETYGELFAENPTLRAEAVGELVVGNLVTHHERLFVDGEQVGEAIGTYRVVDGKITHLWLARPDG